MLYEKDANIREFTGEMERKPVSPEEAVRTATIAYDTFVERASRALLRYFEEHEIDLNDYNRDPARLETDRNLLEEPDDDLAGLLEEKGTKGPIQLATVKRTRPVKIGPDYVSRTEQRIHLCIYCKEDEYRLFWVYDEEREKEFVKSMPETELDIVEFEFNSRRALELSTNPNTAEWVA